MVAGRQEGGPLPLLHSSLAAAANMCCMWQVSPRVRCVLQIGAVLWEPVGLPQTRVSPADCLTAELFNTSAWKYVAGGFGRPPPPLMSHSALISLHYSIDRPTYLLLLATRL